MEYESSFTILLLRIKTLRKKNIVTLVRGIDTSSKSIANAKPYSYKILKVNWQLPYWYH